MFAQKAISYSCLGLESIPLIVDIVTFETKEDILKKQSMKKNPIIKQILQYCSVADRAKLLSLVAKSTKSTNGLKKLEKAISDSIDVVQKRKVNQPSVNLNKELPFYEKRELLKKTILHNQVVIVCGETGSGKTTQLPQICLELGLAEKGKIGHTQPRRLAARSVTSRIAEELGSKTGEAVGYKIRFNDTTRPESYIKIMTDGILLAEIQQDRWLNEYQTIIIDEAHERSLNIDLLLGFLKELLSRRSDLKLIITSATIDPQRFSRYFNDAPLVTVSGRTYPVDIYYRPFSDERDRLQAVMDALDELFKKGAEDTLIFFPGERQIREAAERISKRFHQYEVLPLYARLTHEQQKRIFKLGAKRKIILSTNVAETSLTIPGIRYVIDTGLARISRYSWRAKVQRLPVEKISQASANQRAGRCGRVAAGICVRLYDEDDFNNRSEFTDPEILRTNLASVILQMDSLKVGHISDFDFIEAPDSRLINDGYRLLHELKAVEVNDVVTKTGKNIGRLPIDPRLAGMILQAGQAGCLQEMLVITSVLSVQDPRDTSIENRQAANEKFKLWQDENSDFISWLNLWNEINQQKKTLSRNQFTKWCKSNYLSWLRIREWQDIYNQIREQSKQLKLTLNSSAASSEQIHRAILSGIPSHVAALDLEGNYQTTRGREATIFPASVLAKKIPKWIMAFSLIDTSKLFAHVVSGLNPQWIMADLKHLHQYEYYEPYWQEKQGRVAAYRNTKIYGLMIEGGKRVNFANINPKQSREIFIREALVEGRYQTSIQFVKDNRKLIGFYKDQENRERRRDLLIGDEQMFDFYDQHLPATTVDAISFESWAKKLDHLTVKKMTLFDQDVLQTAHEKDIRSYPETLVVKNQTLSLSYVFDPSNEADGVTVMMPLAVLNQFDDSDFDCLVPGFLQEKIQALIKVLPKQLRKNFIPAPDFASACYQNCDLSKPLYMQLSVYLKRMTGVDVELNQWQPQLIDKHFQMRYCLVKGGTIIASSRSLIGLQQQYSDLANEYFEEQVEDDSNITRENILGWDFDHLPQQVILNHFGSKISAFPALVDYQDFVSIELFDTKQDAAFYHSTGVARLIAFELAQEIKYAIKNLPHLDDSALMYVSLGTKQELIEDIIMASIFDCFLTHDTPENQSQFQQLIANHKSMFLQTVNDKAINAYKILILYRQTRNQLQSTDIAEAHFDDCLEQCEHLVYEGFILCTPSQQLLRLPVYFQALNKRLDKMKLDTLPSDKALPIVRRLWEEYLVLQEREGADIEKVSQLRWMIEEFRIISFAQPMKPRVPVSENKIRKLIGVINGSVV